MANSGGALCQRTSAKYETISNVKKLMPMGSRMLASGNVSPVRKTANSVKKPRYLKNIKIERLKQIPAGMTQ